MAKVQDQFKLRVITPAGTALETDSTFVKFHAQGGEIGVIQDHAPTLAKIKPGELIVQKDEQKDLYFITDGIAEIKQDQVTLLVPFLEKGSELDLDRVKDAEKRAVARIEKPTSDTDTSRAKDALTRARARLYLHELLEKVGKN